MLSRKLSTERLMKQRLRQISETLRESTMSCYMRRRQLQLLRKAEEDAEAARKAGAAVKTEKETSDASDKRLAGAAEEAAQKEAEGKRKEEEIERQEKEAEVVLAKRDARRARQKQIEDLEAAALEREYKAVEIEARRKAVADAEREAAEAKRAQVDEERSRTTKLVEEGKREKERLDKAEVDKVVELDRLSQIEFLMRKDSREKAKEDKAKANEYRMDKAWSDQGKSPQRSRQQSCRCRFTLSRPRPLSRGAGAQPTGPSGPGTARRTGGHRLRAKRVGVGAQAAG